MTYLHMLHFLEIKMFLGQGNYLGQMSNHFYFWCFRSKWLKIKVRTCIAVWCVSAWVLCLCYVVVYIFYVCLRVFVCVTSPPSFTYTHVSMYVFTFKYYSRCREIVVLDSWPRNRQGTHTHKAGISMCCVHVRVFN